MLEALSKHENTGCAHIRMLLKYPDLYQIKPEIVRMFLKSFYKILWEDDSPLATKLKLDVLVGTHNEGAFVEVRSNEVCTAEGIVPLIKPREKRANGNSIFVNHLDAASIRRVQLARFFADEVNHHSVPIDPEVMHNRMNHHGMSFLETTGSYLAKNLPFFTLSFI